jgi:hypothetical protein
MHVWAGPLHIPYMPRPHIIPLMTAEPINARCVMISRLRFGMFRGPFEMDVGDGVAVMRRSR